MNNISADLLLARYAAGERDFSGVRISYDEVFQDADLTGISFQGADLNCRFENVSLANANFSKSGLSATFINVDLTDANFTESESYKCKFQDSKLQGVSLRGFRFNTSWIENCDFSMTELSHSWLSIVRIKNSNFSESDLSSSWISDVRIEDSCVDRASFKESIIVNMDLSESTFKEADFTKALINFDGFPVDNLSDKSIIVKDAIRIKPGSDMRNVKLSGLNLSYFNFRECDLRDADLSNCNLMETDFNDCDLRGTNFLNSELDEYWTEGSIFGGTIMPDGSVRALNV